MKPAEGEAGVTARVLKHVLIETKQIRLQHLREAHGGGRGIGVLRLALLSLMPLMG